MKIKFCLCFLLFISTSVFTYGQIPESTFDIFANNYDGNISDVKEFISRDTTVVLFTAPWSGPGKMAKAHIEIVAANLSDRCARFGTVNLQGNGSANDYHAAFLGIIDVPIVIISVGGNVVYRYAGFRSIKTSLELFLRGYLKSTR